MLKIGIMGAAKIVPRFVAGVKESGQAEVIGIAARNKEKAQKAAVLRLHSDPLAELIFYIFPQAAA